MEAEQLILPDNTIIDTTQPPPGFNFPRPDFTEIIQDHDKAEPPVLKPTFKNILQAKKRLQAFSSTRPASIPSSPKKVKSGTGNEEKSEETTPPAKKPPRKGTQERAKSLIEQIEELKKEERAYLETRFSVKRSRSKSGSPDKSRFKKVDKKSRNYRRGSISSPEKPRKSPKKAKKYPRNWREFYDFDANFEINRDFEVSAPAGTNELSRQILFESPSLPIVPFKMKTVNREEKIVPFPYIRYTRTKPVLPYSVNFGAIKDSCLSRKAILESLPKDIIANIEKLYSNSIKFTNDEDDVKVKTFGAWYPKVWKDSENECKIFEKSVGLSFLQNYTGEEDENDFVEEETVPKDEDLKKEETPETDDKDKGEKIEKEICDAEAKEKVEKKKKKKEKVEDEKLDEEQHPDKEAKKKKKKAKKEETDEKSESQEKKKSKHGKEKKKHLDDGTEGVAKKKKRKKDKVKKKKDKRTKEKKLKRKKTKEKKKKDKDKDKEKVEEQPDKPVEKLSKQQVIEELKEIEEKLAKKREECKEKKVEKEEKGRKRKHSERENDAKRTKHEKHRRTSDEHADVKVEHALKNKLEKAKKDMMKNEELKNVSEKHEDVKKEEHTRKHEHKKTRPCEETKVRRRKTRWGESTNDRQFLEFPILTEDQLKTEDFDLEDLKIIEEIKENTPDTDEYHSHWETDDEISSSAPRQSLKLNRSWESDEELFERSHNNSKKPSETYADLEIPLNLNIVTFPRRSSNWEEKPLSVIDELKLLEEERRSLSEERRKLEVERQKILKMQEEAKLELLDEKKVELIPEVKVKKEKIDDFTLDFNNSLSNVSSTESNFPIAALENEYEEFIKAVSSESSVSSKKKPERRSSSSSSSDSDHKKKKRKAKMKKKKKKKKRECEGLLVGKGNDIFNEFDIPVPSEIPEMVPTPVPVPSPILPLESLLPITTPNLLLHSIVDLHEKSILEDAGLDLNKPFVFSSLVLPSKKVQLVDNSNLKLDDDSDSADFTDKFAPEREPIEENNKEEDVVPEEKAEVEEIEEKKLIETKELTKIEEPKTLPEVVEPPPALQPVESVPQIDDIRNVPLPPEKAPPKAPPRPEAKPLETEPKARSRSLSPPRKPMREKRRSRSRSRDRDSKRRSPIRRRELTPPSRRRYSSPRRRSPIRRRGSPRRRSPSPRRRLSPRRRRRSPSLSPPRGRRKRTPSPRRRASPLNSPLDGFKRSVADSTISDDMLPQLNHDDYSQSPPYLGGGKYYDRKKRGSMSPQGSPKRLSLDDRINMVLGLEKNEPPPPPPPVKPQDAYPNYSYNSGYVYNQYQYGQKPDYGPPPFAPIMYTQPPPPIVKPPPTATKVVQVGNILQVVPNEDLPPPPVVENKITERSQKIVQVGNMLQIVPAVIATIKAPVPEPQPVSKPVHSPEKPSAETVMKQKLAERKAEREKRRQERERRRKDKEKKQKEKEKRKQMKLKLKTENMIKRAIQIETEAMANDLEEGAEPAEQPIQWPPVPVIVSTTPNCKGILLQGGAKQRKSVQFADGVRPGEGTSPSGGEELSSPPPQPRKLPKEKRYKKLKIPKKSKKKKVRVKVVKVPTVEVGEDDDDDDNLPPPSPPPGSPPPHVFPSRVKTHTINNVHQYVGSIIQSGAPGYPFRAPMPPVMMNRHQPPPGYMTGGYPQDVNSLSHQAFQGVSSHH